LFQEPIYNSVILLIDVSACKTLKVISSEN